MKSKFILFLLGLTGFVIVSCNRSAKQDNHAEKPGKKSDVVFKDYGPDPTVLDIETYTVENTNFRTTLWTGKNMQVTLMTIPVNGDVGLEQHTDIDQFLRIEEGKGKVLMGDEQNALNFEQIAKEDYAIFVPAGKWHNIINVGDKPLKLYSIYAPAEHPHSTVHKTQQESIDDEHHH